MPQLFAFFFLFFLLFKGAPQPGRLHHVGRQHDRQLHSRARGILLQGQPLDRSPVFRPCTDLLIAFLVFFRMTLFEKDSFYNFFSLHKIVLCQASSSTLVPVTSSFGKQLYYLLARELTANKRDKANIKHQHNLKFIIRARIGSQQQN